MNLHVDDREKAIIDTIRDEISKPSIYGKVDVEIIYKRLDIGDYMITIDIGENQTGVLCIIERKTLADYGASLVDGRSANIEKLLALRNETNCRIQYIVEGAHNPAMSDKFGGIEYGSILANMTDISIVHGIDIIRTKDKRRTAEYLKIACERWYAVYPTIRANIKGAGEINQIVDRCKPSKEEKNLQQLLIIWHNLLSKTDKINMNPISTARALVLAQKWTLKMWIDGAIPRDEIEKISINGRKLQQYQINRLSGPIPIKGQIRLLTCIKGITAVTAEAIISQKQLNTLICYPESANIIINSDKNTRLGKAKYELITNLCLMKA